MTFITAEDLKMTVPAVLGVPMESGIISLTPKRMQAWNRLSYPPSTRDRSNRASDNRNGMENVSAY